MISSKFEFEADLDDSISTIFDDYSDSSVSGSENYEIHNNGTTTEITTRKVNNLRSIKLVKLPSIRLRPNYMKTTTCSIAKKDNFQKPATRFPSTKLRKSSGGSDLKKKKMNKSKSIRIRNRFSVVSSHDAENTQFNKASPRDHLRSKSGLSNKSVLTRTSSMRPVRMLRKMSSLRTNRSYMKKSSQMLNNRNINRATCLSTLKDSKFPNHLELQSGGGSESQGISTIKVCPYTYCSLHGHSSHSTLPPLKRFVSMRRRVLRTQPGRKLETQSSLRPKRSSSNVKKGIRGRKLTGYNDAAIRETASTSQALSSMKKLAGPRADLSREHTCTRDGEGTSCSGSVNEDMLDELSDPIYMQEDQRLSEFPTGESHAITGKMEDTCAQDGEGASCSDSVSEDVLGELSAPIDYMQDDLQLSEFPTGESHEITGKMEDSCARDGEGASALESVRENVFGGLSAPLIYMQDDLQLSEFPTAESNATTGKMEYTCARDGENTSCLESVSVDVLGELSAPIDYMQDNLQVIEFPTEECNTITVKIEEGGVESNSPKFVLSDTETDVIYSSHEEISVLGEVHHEDNEDISSTSNIAVFGCDMELISWEENASEGVVTRTIDKTISPVPIREQREEASAACEEKKRDDFPQTDSEADYKTHVVDKSEMDKQKHMELWNLIYKHMASGIAAEDEVPPAKGEREDADTCPETHKSSSSDLSGTGHGLDLGDNHERGSQIQLYQQTAIKLVKEAFDKILSEIPDQSPDDQSSNCGSTQNKEFAGRNHNREELSIPTSFNGVEEPEKTTLNADTTNGVIVEKTRSETGSKSKQETPSNWSYLKKIIIRNRFVKALDKAKKFNPRKPRFLPIPSDPEAEKIHLRHQSWEEKKKSEEWMLDYALQQVVSTLAPSQKRKVALLVQAFESVGPLPSNGTCPASNFDASSHPNQDESSIVLSYQKSSGKGEETNFGISLRKTSLLNKRSDENLHRINDSFAEAEEDPDSFSMLQKQNLGSSCTSAALSPEIAAAGLKGDLNLADVANPSNNVLANGEVSKSEVHDLDLGFNNQHDVAGTPNYVLADGEVSASKVHDLDLGSKDQHDVANTSKDGLANGEVSASEESATCEEKNGDYIPETDSESDYKTREVDKSEMEKQKHMGLWSLIYKHMASGITAEDKLQAPATEADKDEAEDADTCHGTHKFGSSDFSGIDHGLDVDDNHENSSNIQLYQQSAIKLVKEAFDKILSEIPDQSSDEQSNDSGSTHNKEFSEKHNGDELSIPTSFNSRKEGPAEEPEKTMLNTDITNGVEVEKTQSETGSKSKQETPSNWSYLKKIIIRNRFVKALDKAKKINPRKPRFLPIPSDPEAEKIHLRHQSWEKKNSEEWMLDYALQQVISTLSLSQKRKVALLVQAFESVGPLPHNGTSPVSNFDASSHPTQDESCIGVSYQKNSGKGEQTNFGISLRKTSLPNKRSDENLHHINDLFTEEEEDPDSFSMLQELHSESSCTSEALSSEITAAGLKESFGIINLDNSDHNSVVKDDQPDSINGYLVQDAPKLADVANPLNDVLANGEVSESDVRDVVDTSNYVLADGQASISEVQDLDLGFNAQHDLANSTANDVLVNREVSAYEVHELDLVSNDQNDSHDVLANGEISESEVHDQHDVALASNSNGVLANGEVSASEVYVHDLDLRFNDQHDVANTSNDVLSDGEVSASKVTKGETVLRNKLLQLITPHEESKARLTDLTHEKKKNMGLWHLIYKHMVSGTTTLVDEAEQGSHGVVSNGMNNTEAVHHVAGNEKVDLQQIEAIRMVEEAIDEIPLFDSQDDSPDGNPITREAIQSTAPDPKGSFLNFADTTGGGREKSAFGVANKTEQKTQKSWSNLKKMILLKRFVKALEKVKQLNPREPRLLALDSEKEAEKVLLRHQDMENRKNADEWMLDYALQQVVDKLTPARKRKVQLLVEAFETVVPSIET